MFSRLFFINCDLVSLLVVPVGWGDMEVDKEGFVSNSFLRISCLASLIASVNGILTSCVTPAV